MVGRRKQDVVLKPDALRGVRIAVSVSDSPDLAALGLVETHFRLALAEIARSVLVSGGKLAYGGHLAPDGYTAMLINELHRYSRRDKPLRIYLAWQEHRKLSKSEIEKQASDLGLSGEIVCLDASGKPISKPANRGEAPLPVSNASTGRRALTALRLRMAQDTDCRVIVGGRRANFQGEMPGVLEEALASIQCRQPLYVAGGFGGIAANIAFRMKLLDSDFLPAIGAEAKYDRRVIVGLDKLASAIRDRGIPDNGLTDIENARLAATHRPSEIAALVSLGLGRRFARSKSRASGRIATKHSSANRPRKSKPS